MILKGDTVIILAGKDRGKQGKILRVFPKDSLAVVENANLRQKRTRPKRQNEKGQTISQPHPLHLSNLALLCSSCNRGRRTKTKLVGNKKVRVCAKCGNVI